MNSEPEIVIADRSYRLFLDGFVYVKSKDAGVHTHWDCKKVRSKECSARAVTLIARGARGQVIVLKGPDTSPHDHPPNREAAEAEKKKLNLKRKAEAVSGEPPVAMLREELAGVSSGVLSQLPEREQLKRMIRRARKKNTPPSPTSLADLEEIPENYQKTSIGNQFLMYDSRDNNEPSENRVIVFATRKNLELLSSSTMWFLDGTFKVAPHIFTQMFTILGTVSRVSDRGEPEVVALPFVYALLSSKETWQYKSVLLAVASTAIQYGIQNCQPEMIMCDFELAIINACQEVFPRAAICACFFHLSQSLYRQIQAKGLQAAYNDEADRSIKDFTHMLAALAFVPISDVECYFARLKGIAPEEMKEYVAYFDATYVSGISRRGRRNAVPPRFPIHIWNQYDAAVEGKAKTNNVSEGWHNRFHLLMRKNHPDIFSFIKEIMKEQGDSEIAVVELSLGRRIKAAPKKKWLEVQAKIRRIVLNYETYEILDYLKAIGQTIVI